MRLLLLLLSFLGGWSAVLVQADHVDSHSLVGFAAETLRNVKLPSPLSDFGIALNNEAQVYLAGGCNSENGNEFVAEFGEFACLSLSNQLVTFDIATESVVSTVDMPTARYRHAAVFVDQRLWLVGGRDEEDGLIGTVDVYDTDLETWSTFDLDDDYVTSDLAGFAGPDGLPYFVGGYNLTYTAMPTVFAIDPDATFANSSSSELVVVEKAPLPTARGDLSAVSIVTDAGVAYALATGGFTHENDFCEPLATTEYYNFDKDTWRQAADLQVARADKALVVLGHRAYGIGGERQIANICNIDKPEPGEETVPLNDVEYYNVETDEWVQLKDLERHRFRFSAVGYEDTIYSFGGQLAFNKDCQCFRASDEVTVYTEMFEEGDKSGAAATAAVTMVGALVAAMGLALIWM